ncbi:MAG TPA: hypothetical protein DIW07_09045 [Lachnospiraceae bacterium]|nr:hypothetical protein [Lachnospiraceae bacterium]
MSENILRVLSVVHHMTYSEVESLFSEWLNQGIKNVIVCGQHTNEFMLLHLKGEDEDVGNLGTRVLYVGRFDKVI